MKNKNFDFLNLAKRRKTCYEFSDRKVLDSDIKKILEAGRWAPSFSNMQPWRYKVVENKKTIEKLMKNLSYGAFHTLPQVVIVLILPKDIVGGEQRGVLNKRTGFVESNLCLAFAASQMVLEAEDMGINSAILSPDNQKTIKILSLEKKDFVSLVIAFGYEKKGAFQKKRERKSLSELEY